MGLEWTGERFVPWAREAAVAYEHLHRYVWASNLVKAKRVLDLACGEGYGSNLLARDAAYVCGVDIDDRTIEHAKSRYRRPNLEFLRASVTEIPIPETSSFDVVVCFEAIEHIEAHDALMREVVRLLKPDGYFIVSTPNKSIYRGHEEPNPFHVHELTFDEFHALLSQHFSHVLYFGQDVHPGSTIWPLAISDERDVREFAITRVDDEFRLLPDEQRAALYFVAIASRGAGDAEFRGSVLVDYSDEMIKEKDREFEAKVRQRDEALDWRASQVEDLERSKKRLNADIESLLEEIAKVRQELAEIHQSRSWRFVLKLRGLREKLHRLTGGL